MALHGRATAVLAAACTVLLLVQPLAVAGHGLLSYPPHRTAFNSGDNAYTCAHCLNAGGTNEQSSSRTQTYTDQFPSTALHRICGDPVSHPARNEGSFPSTKVTIDDDGSFRVDVVITTNHWGKMCFRVFTNPADVDAGNENAAQKIYREDDPSNNCVYPPQQDGTDGDGLVFVGSATKDNWGEGWGNLYRAWFKWPGLSCEGYCVLHMHWTTGHSCTPPGIPAGNVKYYNPTWPTPACGDPSIWPEQFWNCANFIVDGTVAVVETASNEPTVTTKWGDRIYWPGPDKGDGRGPQCGNYNKIKNIKRCKEQAPKPAPVSNAAARVAGDIPAYQACGDEATPAFPNSSCQAGLACAQQNKYYSQCLPQAEVPATYVVQYHV